MFKTECGINTEALYGNQLLHAIGEAVALKYKLEFNKPSGSTDDSVFIHLRIDPDEYYRFRTGKEDYADLDAEDQDSFANGLFAITGIEEISVTAYRVWYMKSPVFTWKEVNEAALEFMVNFFGEDELEEISGSARLDGQGLRLDSDKDRRVF